MKQKIVTVLGLIGLVALGTVSADSDDVDYAKKLWDTLVDRNLVGKDGIMSAPYKGVHPHGTILDTIEGKVTVGDNTGITIIKRNYGGEGIDRQAVANDPEKWLEAVTVMYKRDGYDPENRDWFWVKYNPQGSVMKNPKGAPLAGRSVKAAIKAVSPVIRMPRATIWYSITTNTDRSTDFRAVATRWYRLCGDCLSVFAGV